MNKKCFFINCILTYERFFPSYFYTVLWDIIYYFLLFCATGVLFCAWVVIFPPAGAVVTECAAPARGVRSQEWHHNERQRSAVPQDLYSPLWARQVRDRPMEISSTEGWGWGGWGDCSKNTISAVCFFNDFRRYSGVDCRSRNILKLIVKEYFKWKSIKKKIKLHVITNISSLDRPSRINITSIL